jgi:hypothetical protein
VHGPAVDGAARSDQRLTGDLAAEDALALFLGLRPRKRLTSISSRSRIEINSSTALGDRFVMGRRDTTPPAEV